jgi:class 3 adenylate cyclase/tetratricopeptide (TPR) repeat protein
MGEALEAQRLPHWTLNVRLSEGTFDFTLADGHRFARCSSCSQDVLLQALMPSMAKDLLGAAIADPLVASAPRSLSILYDVDDGGGVLDRIEWERLDLGVARLGQHVAVSRQLVSDADFVQPIPPSFAEHLEVVLVHDGQERQDLPARRVAIETLDQDAVRLDVATAHVIVVDGVSLHRLVDDIEWPLRRRLFVVAGPLSARRIEGVLDMGGAVLSLGNANAPLGAPVLSLLRQLGNGLSVGEAVRRLRRQAAPDLSNARLYGDAEMQFLQPEAQNSRRQVTSLSFDIVRSTAMLETIGAEAYAEILSKVHARCADVVRGQGGRPNDHQGNDGVMVYFGHPSAIEDPAVHAVAAGLDIVRVVAALGVSVRIGITTGMVTVKSGHPHGISIHLASRLQQAAAPGTLLVSSEIREQVMHVFDLEELKDRPPVEDINGADVIYLVLGPRGDVREHRLDRQSQLTPFVGRQAELQRLHQCWQTTRPGHARLAVVSAEPGMGKSRLVREFRHQLGHLGVKVLECQCRKEANNSPFMTLAEALRRWLGIAAGDDATEGVKKLAAAVPPAARDTKSVEVLAGILGIAPQPARTGAGDFRQQQLAVLTEAFNAFAREWPCCLFVEDWQWTDPSMRRFVEHLVEGAGSPELFIVVTVRSNAEPLPFATVEHEHIELGGLPPDQARMLVDRVCSGTALPLHLVQSLAIRGDGVPLFLEESARLALDKGVDEAERALKRVPGSLTGLLYGRLEHLSGATRYVAQVAAVLGRRFSRALLASLLDRVSDSFDSQTLDERLGALVKSGLVTAEKEGWFAFRHALIRDAAYDLLSDSQCRKLHEQVVVLLQTECPELAEQQPELLALHQKNAALFPEALAQYERAARHAAARSAEVEAMSHLRHALEILPRTEAGAERDRTALRLQLLLAARLIATEGYGADAVRLAYLEAERLCDRIGDETSRFKVEMGLEAYRFMRADFAPALEHGRRAAGIATRSGDVKQRLHAHWCIACTLFHKGELRASLREMEAALALYTPAMHPQFGVQDPGVMCLAYSAWALWELGQPDAAIARINEAVSIANEFEHRFSQAVALAYAVSIELLRGDSDAAMARADICTRVCEDFGFPVWLAITCCMRGYLLCERGAFDEGLLAMRTGYAQWLATGALVSQPLYLSLQVEGLLLAGDVRSAALRVDEGLLIIERCGERQLVAELMRLQGEVASRLGDAARGEACLKRAYATALRERRFGFALRSATALARHWASTGQHRRARNLLEPLAARWTEGLGTRDLRSAWVVVESCGETSRRYG